MTTVSTRSSSPAGSTFDASEKSGAPNAAAPAETPLDAFQTASGSQSAAPLNQQLDPLAPEAVDAIAKTIGALSIPAAQGFMRAPKPEFEPLSVEKDELGMTHVRLARRHNGLPVFAEQIIGHLDKNGQLASVTGAVRPIESDLGSRAPKVSQADAILLAREAYGKVVDVPPTATRMVARVEDGTYRDVFRVQTRNYHGAVPEEANFLVDASTGAVLRRWDQSSAFFDQGALSRMAAAAPGEPTTGPYAAPMAGDRIHIERAATPGMPLVDYTSTAWKLDVTDNAAVESLKLNLDISHTSVSDLFITLTSPSGKLFAAYPNIASGNPDVKGQLDLSSAFQGEDARGTWTLTVSEMGLGDSGTLNGWGLSIDGPFKGEAPPLPVRPEGADRTIYNGDVEIGGTQTPNGQLMFDETRGKGIETVDLTEKPDPADAKPIYDANGAWGENGDSPLEWSAVDAQYGAQMTYDFYRDVLKRDSIDGKGEKLRNNVHFGHNMPNAFWSRDLSVMLYGDGDNKLVSTMTTLDIAGHEITHGLTCRTADLVYDLQSGAINESMSDIMGSGVEWYAMKRNPAIHADPNMMGEQAYTPLVPGDALRYFDDPRRDGESIDHYRHFKTIKDVHLASGIMNNAFHLLVHGGTNRTSRTKVDGLESKLTYDESMERGFRIFGRALTTYMTPDSTFASVRKATLQAATDLYGAGSDEVRQVDAAWAAVGVDATTV